MGGSRWTLVAMSLGFAVVQLDVSVVNVAIRPIGDDLGGGISALQWIVNAYMLIAYALAALALVAVGLIVPLMTSELLASVDRSRSGIASGTLNTMRQTGSVVGVALFGSLLAGGVVGGLHASFVISIALLVATGGLALVLP